MLLNSSLAQAISRSYFMAFDTGTTLSQPAVKTNTSCPLGSDVALGSTPGISLLSATDNTTCVPPSNRDLIWSSASPTFSLYYNGAGYASASDIAGISVGISIRSVDSTGTLVVKLFYTTASNNKVYFSGTPATQSVTSTRKSYTINLSSLHAENVPAGAKIAVEFSWPRASGGMRLSVNQSSSNDKLIVDETPAGGVTALADYHMDDAAWNGSANEVLDSSGGYHGRAGSLAATKPSTANSASAIAGSPGTCGYGVFNRTNKDYVALPSTFPNLGANGQAFTITAWVKTTNNSLPHQRIFIDDENNSTGYGFSIGDGGTGKVRFFSRGTASALILDTESVVSSNTWYFVAAVADVPNKRKRIYVFNTAGSLLSSVNASWDEASFGADNGIASIGGETNASASEANNSFGFAGNIDELQIFQSALSQANIQSLMSRTRSCNAAPPASLNPFAFNCVAAGGNALNGHLYTKLSATPFGFEVVALKDTNSDGVADAVQTAYASDVNRTVTVELVDGSGTGDCKLRAALSPAVRQNLTFNQSAQGTEQGRKSIAGFIVDKAYADLRCRVTDATNSAAPVVGCSTDNFSVRPTVLTVTSNANGSATIKAGSPFTLTAASGVAGYDGSPKIEPSLINAHANATSVGGLTGTFVGADPATGAATSAGFSYSEVGYFNLSPQGIYDDTFTLVDALAGDCTHDFANDTAQAKIGCKFGNSTTSADFGRFIPDHFDVTLNDPEFAPSCGNFSYVGQAIRYQSNPELAVEAKNAAGEITQNYTGSFWRIDPTNASFRIVPSYSEASQPLTVLNVSTPRVTDSEDGTGLLSFADTTSPILGITRNAPLAPFNAEIALSFTLRDTDGVAVANINGLPGVNPVQFGVASAGNGMAFTGGNKTLRWGRLVLQNAFGTELQALSVPLFAEHYTNAGFVKNNDDQCSVLSLSNHLTLSNPATARGAAQPGNTAMTLAGGTSLASLANPTLVAGEAGLSFSAPGSGNTGYITISANVASMPWLLFDWDHDRTHDNSPTARATFGIYKGHQQQIYLREVY